MKSKLYFFTLTFYYSSLIFYYLMVYGEPALVRPLKDIDQLSPLPLAL